MTEQWRDVPDFPGYKVSDQGRVLGRQGGILKPYRTGRNGNYRRVQLYQGGTSKQRFVHRLVLAAFVGPPPTPGLDCRHLDGDPTNNRLENLAYGTQKENADDRVLHGTDPVGERNPTAKLTWDDVREIREAYQRPYWGLGTDLAGKYGVSRQVIYRIKDGKLWKEADAPAES